MKQIKNLSLTSLNKRFWYGFVYFFEYNYDSKRVELIASESNYNIMEYSIRDYRGIASLDYYILTDSLSFNSQWPR